MKNFNVKVSIVLYENIEVIFINMFLFKTTIDCGRIKLSLVYYGNMYIYAGTVQLVIIYRSFKMNGLSYGNPW